MGRGGQQPGPRRGDFAGADLVAAARAQAGDVLGELSARNAISGKVHASYSAFRERSALWSRVSIEAVLRARG